MATYYPPAGFHFKVEFLGVSGMDNETGQRFQEVGGLSFEIETELFREGGENRFEYKLPKRIKYPNLVLKRGLLNNKALIDWINKATSNWFNVVIYGFSPADLIVTLLDEADQAVAVWKVVQAYPVKWAMTDLKATDNSIVVETLELAYQYFERQQ
jgi:phage tail-like protein